MIDVLNAVASNGEKKKYDRNFSIDFKKKKKKKKKALSDSIVIYAVKNQKRVFFSNVFKKEPI